MPSGGQGREQTNVTERTVVCTGTGKDMDPARLGYEGECRKAAQQQVKAIIFILTTDFSRTFLVLKYEHRENRQKTASLATGVPAARPTRTPAMLHACPSNAPRTLRRT